MPRRFATNLALALLTAAAATQLSAEQPLRVTAVRFWPQPAGIRIAVETNAEFRFHTERLAGPDRVFFDLFGARSGLGGKGIRSLPVNHRLLKRIRVAETLPGVTRIVLDLSGEADVAASQLTNPDRLMIEVRPRSETSVAGAPPGVPGAVFMPRAAGLLRSRYPDWQNFSDPAFVKDEFEYKQMYSQKVQDLLSKDTMPQLLAEGKYDQIIKRLEKAGQSSNLLYLAAPKTSDLSVLYSDNLNQDKLL